MIIFREKQYSIQDNYDYDYDYLVAKHEAGHLIFLIRGLKEEYGVSKARSIIHEYKFPIIMEKKGYVSTRKRKAQLHSGKFKFNDNELNFNFNAGGLAVDMITGRKNSGFPIMTLLKPELDKYGYLYKKDSELFRDLVKGDFRMMLNLIDCGKYQGTQDILQRINKLSKSITKKEMDIVDEIAEKIVDSLKKEDKVVFDTTKYALKLL